MKEFLIKYFREILLIVFGIILVFLILKIYKPVEDKSELLKYKIDQLDITINNLKEKQTRLNDSIKFYKNEIDLINDNIENIRSQKTTINNFYEVKDKEIPKWSNTKVDSAFRERYKY